MKQLASFLLIFCLVSPAAAQVNDLQTGFLAMMSVFKDWNNAHQRRVRREWIADYARELRRARAEASAQVPPDASPAVHAEAVSHAVRRTWRAYRERYHNEMVLGFEQMAETLNGSIVYVHERAAESTRDRREYDRLADNLSAVTLRKAAGAGSPDRLLEETRIALRDCFSARTGCPAPEPEPAVAEER